LAEDLQDPEFARQFLTAAVEDGVPLKAALAKVIRATGVKEFSESVGMPSPNVLRAINPKSNPTQETLERLLKPFGLRIGLALELPGISGQIVSVTMPRAGQHAPARS
jgi:DNA-binding phage protein